MKQPGLAPAWLAFQLTASIQSPGPAAGLGRERWGTCQL